MHKPKPKFIRAFEQDIELQRQNIDPLSHAVPPLKSVLHYQIKQLLNKIRDEVSMVTVLGFNSQFFNLTRKMMLLDSLEQQQLHVDYSMLNGQLYISSKIEIVPMQPIEWIYGQIQLKKDDLDLSLSPIRRNQADFMDLDVGISMRASFFGSSVVIIDARDYQGLNQLVKILKDNYDKVVEMPSAFPKIFAIFNSKTQKQNDVIVKLDALKNRGIYVETIASNVKEQWEEQYRLISVGKTIINRLKFKQIDKVPLTSRLLSIIWATLAISDESVPISTIWQKAQASLVQQQSQSVLQQYLSRIQDVTQGKKIISSTFLKQAEAKVRNDVMRLVSEKAGLLPQSESIIKTERRLLDLKQEMENKNTRAVIEWGRNFLKEAWNAVQHKIGRQIKNLFGLRQQTLIFFQFFKKKSQQFLSVQLLLLLIDFLIPKLFEAVQVVTNTIVNPIQKKYMQMETQLMDLQLQNKELKRRGTKEDGQIFRRLKDNQDKIKLLQMDNKVAEQNLQSAKQELSQQIQAYELKISNIQIEYSRNTKENKNKIEELNELLQSSQKKVSILQSELTKQKLLHQQTKQFYEQTVDMIKKRYEMARQQLEEVSLSASRQLHNLRIESTKQIGSHQLTNAELIQKIEEIQNVVIKKEEQIQDMKMEIDVLKEGIVDQQSLMKKIEMLEVDKNSYQDIQLQHEALTSKFQKLEEELKKCLKQREVYVAQHHENITQNIIIEEKNKTLKKELEECQAKIRQLKEQMHNEMLQRQQLEENKVRFQDEITKYQENVAIYEENTLKFEDTIVKYKERIKEYEEKEKNCCEIQQRYEQKFKIIQQKQIQNKKEYQSIGFQIEDNTLKQKLMQALETIKLLENDYNKVKNQYQWRRFKI